MRNKDQIVAKVQDSQYLLQNSVITIILSDGYYVVGRINLCISICYCHEIIQFQIILLHRPS